MVGARLAGTSLIKMATLLGVSRAAVSKVMTAYTNHVKTSLVKRNGGLNPELSERYRLTLKRYVSEIIHLLQQSDSRTQYSSLRPYFYKRVQRELHKSNICGTAAIAKPLITDNNAKREKKWCNDHKSCSVIIGNR